MVQFSTDSQCSLGSVISGQVSLQRGVWSIFDQAKSKQWGGNTEDHVTLGQLGGEVRLLDVAARGVRAALDGEQAVHATIESGKRVVRVGGDEARLTHRTVRPDEGGYDVGGAIQRRQCHLWIRSGVDPAVQARAAAARRRLTVT